MRAGFTLVEVMVAIAVASLLIVGVTASTQATVRTAQQQKGEARAEEERSRAIELFRQDWRGRVRLVKPMKTPPPGDRVLVLTTTGDSVATAGRGGRLTTYTASSRGLVRREAEAEVTLLPGPVTMEFWDGVSWREEPGGRRPVVRLRLQNPEESVVIR